MKVKSRYTIIGIILALALTVVAVVPALAGTRSGKAGDITLKLDVRESVTSTTVQNTLVAPSTLYVSNKAAAYNAVLVTVTDEGKMDSVTGTTATVTVQNVTLQTSIAGTTLTVTELTDGVFTGSFVVDAIGTATSPPAVKATGDGQIIRVTTGEGVAAVSLDLTVDGTGPTITNLAPLNNVVQSTVTASFSGLIDDATAGLEKSGAVPQPVVTSGVPDDIKINIGGTEKAGNADFTSSGKGFTYVLTSSLAANADNLWFVTATDRVGNKTETDAKPATTALPSAGAAEDKFKIAVDTIKPGIGQADAGIGWDAVNKIDKHDRSSIKLTFTEGGAAGTSNPDNLNTATLAAADFNVVGSTVSGVIHPNLATTTPSTKNIVFLTLASPLSATDKPKVQLLSSAVADVAGNLNNPQDITSLDKIQPALTVTVTGDAAASGRPVAKGAGASAITVTVVSDEALLAAPSIAFNTLAFDVASDNLEVDVENKAAATAVTGSTNTWTRTALLSSVTGSDGTQLISVFVSGTDASGNSNNQTVGSGGAAGTRVNLTLANLFEFDNSLAAATVALTPSTSSTTTESANPFIRIDFAEGAEFNINSLDRLSFGTPPVSVEIDTHDTVTLTVLTLDGVSVLGSQGTVDSDSFVYKASSLSVGSHTLAFNASDEVGNTLGLTNQSFVFTVTARLPYSVPLSPGWNLISLPGDPSDTAIDTVLPSTHPATSVVSYDTSSGVGIWLVAGRAAEGTWTGTLSTIDSSHAYWISTTAFTPISTLIPERDPAGVLPTIAVKAGWNLVPVVDLQIAAAGGGPGGNTTSAADYFTSITWSVAYSFDTQRQHLVQADLQHRQCGER